jgi:large subunit ribosomal protein L23
MKNASDIILAPLVTEKLAHLAEHGNVVVFKVHPDANKIEIGRAVEALWKLKVERVRTANFPGKKRRMGRFVGRRADWKKAIVTLAEGHSVPDFSA